MLWPDIHSREGEVKVNFHEIVDEYWDKCPRRGGSLLVKNEDGLVLLAADIPFLLNSPWASSQCSVTDSNWTGH